MEGTNTMDTVYTSSWTLVPNPLLPRYRLKDGAQGAEWTAGAHAARTCWSCTSNSSLASSKMLLKVTPMTCRPISLLWSVSTPSLVLPSGCLPNICPQPARLFHGTPLPRVIWLLLFCYFCVFSFTYNLWKQNWHHIVHILPYCFLIRFLILGIISHAI